MDREEQQPAYIYIPSLAFEADPATEGTASHNITEVWVYVNDQMLGAYDLPATIPVLASGSASVRCFAGIKNNGISSTRIKYPFYSSYDLTLDLQPLQYDTIVPDFHYLPDIAIQEFDFEAGIPFEPYGTSDDELVSVTDPAYVFEGNASAYSLLDGTENQLIVRSFDQWEWEAGNTVFLEMNYSSNNTFSVGLVVHKGVSVTRSFALVINSTRTGTGVPVWNKIYVDMGYVVLNNPGADFYELYVESIRDNSNPAAELYLDNLKVVSYQY